VAIVKLIRSLKLRNSIWNKEGFPEEWKDSIIVPICKKVYETDRSKCRGISLLPITYKIVFTVLLSRLTLYAKEIIAIVLNFDAKCQLLII